MSLIELIVDATFLLFFLSIPVGIVLSIIEPIIIFKCHELYMHYRFRGGACWGMKLCGHPKCRLRHFCPIYQHAITPEVIVELESMLKERHRELGMENKQ